MRILWSVNTVSPRVAEKINITSFHAISWVEAMSERLKSREDVFMAIVVPTNESILRKAEVDGICYYLLPKSKKLCNAWKEIVSDFKPDIIHVYGTERTHNLSLIEETVNKMPIVVSLQGIIAEYEKHYYGGLSKKEILKNYTLADIVLKQGVFEGKKAFKKQKECEFAILNKVSYIEGRSDWDRVMSERISPNRTYYFCPRMIRSPFFDVVRNDEEVLQHSIFVHQGGYPIKGLHFMLDALKILKNKYPDVKLYISGTDFFKTLSFKHKLLETGYVKYIKRIIKKNDLMNNIQFTGRLDAFGMAQELAKMHVCVVPSVIENAPNSLAEAMIVGTPCVASYVGGNPDMLDNGLAGYLYRATEAPMLAERIMSVFEKKQETEKKSAYAKKIARERHDPLKLETTIMNIYKDIIMDFKKNNADGKK